MDSQLLIQNRVFTIRGMRVMIDFHLAELYDVETKALNQGVKRNLRRFPNDFMFQLTEKEWRGLKNEIAISNADADATNSLAPNTKAGMRSQIVTAYKRNKTLLPYVFTEQGVAMLSTALKSDRAIDVNITIIRAFVVLRQHLTNYQELTEKISALEKQMNRKFKDVYEALNHLMNNNSPAEIGFKQTSKNP